MTKAKENEKLLKTKTRPPVVTIMGHVDHGKTTLLDYIRKSRVAEKEYGGITQHIGAYQVEVKGKPITFIDTPGHEAFAAMRARGAKVTDIVILVVAADDGVKPQTKESINHIKVSGVPFIVAINKMDTPGANVERVKKGLSENGVLVEDYGGDVVAVPISAKTGQGVDELLEMVCLVAEMSELKDESDEPFEAVVIESSLSKFRGPVATILVKKGKISVGELIASEKSNGKVRALIDSNGKNIREASVSMPVEVLGFEQVPGVGEIVRKVEKHDQKVENTTVRERRTELDKLEQKEISEINLIIKADVVGSLEAINASLVSLSNEKQKVNILLKETGEINESDVLLAKSTGSIIIGFNVPVSNNAQRLAEIERVMIRRFNVIYELVDELKEGLEALIKSKEEVILGKGKIIAIFETSFGKVAGTKVLEGRFTKNDRINILRGEEKLGTARVKTIRHLQEEITTAREGEEYGILLDTKVEFAVDDIIVAIS
jgi:translation initiation factor IF-2